MFAALLIILIVIIALKPKFNRKQAIIYKPPSAAEIERKRKAELKAAALMAREKAKAEKEQAEKAQADEDIPYLKNQLERYYEMIADAKTELKCARSKVEYDLSMNEYGAVFPEKEVNKHIAARDKALTKVIKLENQIHAAEKKLNKALQIAGK